MATAPRRATPARQAGKDDLRKAGILLMKTLTDQFSVYQKPVSTKQAKDIPKEVHAFLDRYLKTTNAEVFGSLAMQSYTHAARTPGDLDVVVQNPQYVAQYIANELRRAGHRAVVEQHPWIGGFAVKIARPDGTAVSVADVHDVNYPRLKPGACSEGPLRGTGLQFNGCEG